MNYSQIVFIFVKSYSFTLFRRLNRTILRNSYYLCTMKPRIIYKGISLAKFNKSFQSDEDCYEYLADMKWEGDYFVCKRCGNTHYCKGLLPFARRCTRCKHDESPTAGTIFNKIRISLLSAFRIVFDMCISEKSMSSSKLAEEYGIRQKTIWEFKRKMQLVLNSQNHIFFNGMVIISDFYVIEQDSDQPKNIVLVAMELLANGEIGKAYGIFLDYFSSEQILSFFEKHISTDAKVYFSKERNYGQYVTNYHIETFEDNFLLTLSSTHITNLKNWLFGVHRHILPEYIQGYLDEYYFRFNRRNNKAKIFDEFMGLMMLHQPNRNSR